MLAQNQAVKRRTNSTGAATPPFTGLSASAGENGDKTAHLSQGRAVTASPASTPASAPPTAAGGTAGKMPSPAYHHRPSYSMSYGDRLTSAQALRNAPQQPANSSIAGKASPPAPVGRSPYYGMTGPNRPPSAPNASSTAIGTAGVKTSGSPPLPTSSSAGAAGSPTSPHRKSVDRPANSAFGYLFGGGAANRVATDMPGARPGLPGSNNSGLQSQANRQASSSRSPSMQAQTSPQVAQASRPVGGIGLGVKEEPNVHQRPLTQSNGVPGYSAALNRPPSANQSGLYGARQDSDTSAGARMHTRINATGQSQSIDSRMSPSLAHQASAANGKASPDLSAIEAQVSFHRYRGCTTMFHIADHL